MATTIHSFDAIEFEANLTQHRVGGGLKHSLLNVYVHNLAEIFPFSQKMFFVLVVLHEKTKDDRNIYHRLHELRKSATDKTKGHGPGVMQSNQVARPYALQYLDIRLIKIHFSATLS